LGDGERVGAGPDESAGGQQRFTRGGRDIFELKRHRIDGVGKGGEGGGVGIAGEGCFGRHARCGAVGFVGIDMHIKAKLGGGDGQHSAELAPAQDADHGAGAQHGHSGLSAMAAVCASR
jgi:hypothetical protein